MGKFSIFSPISEHYCIPLHADVVPLFLRHATPESGILLNLVVLLFCDMPFVKNAEKGWKIFSVSWRYEKVQAFFGQKYCCSYLRQHFNQWCVVLPSRKCNWWLPTNFAVWTDEKWIIPNNVILLHLRGWPSCFLEMYSLSYLYILSCTSKNNY